ncbi:hypothetical protein P22_0441 [Propionispora sp. 2/2-37]|uniref:DUF3231 family protein n=1 Tax=Propionispora sp. 2/2-37 TaxID=1677858 RepID=UPI0006BB8901|nr:DUF3231 family protein [Propionispora sp. 2/2-37]CUH94375.1 hypothetical protein P22_0441 [Propionispora sp. 2/2-37]
MSLLDRVNSETRNIFNMFFDKEPLNYLEAASLYGVVGQGRLNIVILEIMYNHAQDAELKKLIKEAIESHTGSLIEESEAFLENSGAEVPSLQFQKRTLHRSPMEIPEDARASDREIALTLATLAKASQTALLGALHQSYQLDVALLYREMLDKGLDWDYRLLQLALDRGWLPHLAKITQH